MVVRVRDGASLVRGRPLWGQWEDVWERAEDKRDAKIAPVFDLSTWFNGSISNWDVEDCEEEQVWIMGGELSGKLQFGFGHANFEVSDIQVEMPIKH